MNMIFFILIMSFSFTAMTSTHTARIVKLENSAEVFVPGENKDGDLKHVKYLGSVYHVVPAVKGFKLENGYILTTGPKSKAKIIFKNGDHLFVSENTQYKIDWKREFLDKEDPSVIRLLRGAVRGLIEKDGPRSGMKVVTETSVMGVRGTDFHVSERRGLLSVTVLRGEVELSNEKNSSAPVKIKAGHILTKENNVINLNVITKEDLVQIAKGSTIVGTSQDVKPEEAKELVQLEDNASKVTLNDIKEYQPQLYKELTEKRNVEMTSDSLAINTIKIMEEKAPARFKKANEKDLEDSKDPYDKYKFKKD